MLTHRSPRARAVPLCLLCTAGALVAQAGRSPTLLADLNPAPVPAATAFDRGFLAGDASHAWFLAEDDGTDQWLVRTDGTPAGTVPLVRFDATRSGKRYEGVVHPDGALILLIHGGRGSVPVLVAQRPDRATLEPLTSLPNDSMWVGSSMAVWSDSVWFAVTAADGVPELWQTDGSAAGTGPVERLLGLEPVVAAGLDVHGSELWLTARHAEGGSFASKVARSAPANVLVDSQGQPVRGHEVWGRWPTGVVYTVRTALTQWSFLHALRVVDPWTGQTSELLDSGRAAPLPIARTDTRIWFTTSFGQGDLFVTDGTAAHTRWITDGLSDPSSGRSERRGALLGDELVFALNRGAEGRELWRSDGTPSGTRLLADLGLSLLEPGEFRRDSGEVWFRAANQAREFALWSTDGTAAGTRSRLDRLGDDAIAWLRPVHRLRHGLLMAARDARRGGEPWLFDPVTGQATLLANLRSDGATAGSSPKNLHSTGDRAFLSARGADGDTAVFTSDGSATGTRRLDMPTLQGRHYEPMADLPLGHVFAVTTVDGPTEVWSIDPSGHVPNRLADAAATYRVAPPVHTATEFRGELWFHIELESDEVQTWRTDGTSAGTSRIAWLEAREHFRLGTANASLLFLSGYSAEHGAEPWISDGTPEGTRLLADLTAGPTSSDPFDFVPFRDGVLFRTHQYGAERDLWFTDGTPGGTRRLLTGVGWYPPWSTDGRYWAMDAHRAWLRYDDGVHGPEVWTTDGTVEGTRLAFETIPGPDAQWVHTATANRGRLFAVIGPHPSDTALWISDGTPAGSGPVFPTPGSAPFDYLGDLWSLDGDGVLFAAHRLDTGAELWRSDGTAAGTWPLTETWPGRGSGLLYERRSIRDGSSVRVGNRVLFFADDGLTGTELHGIDLEASGSGAIRRIGRGCGATLDWHGGHPSIAQGLDLEVRAGNEAVGALFLDIELQRAMPRPTCEVLLPDALLLAPFVTDLAGRALLPLALPDDPALVGLQFFLQAIASESGGPIGGLAVVANGLECVVGPPRT